MIRSLIMSLYFIFCIVSVKGQLNENEFQQYSVLEGLSDNNVNCIAQDKSGYIWIGTEVGLNRFDGEEFRHFLNRNPLYIPGANIVNIVACSNNRLGVVTRRGFQIFNPIDFSCESYRFPDTSSYDVYANNLLDGRELPDGSVLISSITGIYSFDKPGHLVFRYDAFTAADIGRKRIAFTLRTFSVTDDDVLIYYYDKGNHLFHYEYQNRKLQYIDSTNNRWKAFYPTGWGLHCAKVAPGEFITFSEYSDSLVSYNSLLNKRIVSKIPCLSTQDLNYESKIFKIAANTFAITCSRSGYYLLQLDRSTGIISSDGIRYLPFYKCNYLFIDHDNRLWVGTRSGLLKQKLTNTFVKSFS